VLFQKLCVFVDGERLVAVKNPYMDVFEAKLVR
jgi:hypothetical protein